MKHIHMYIPCSWQTPVCLPPYFEQHPDLPPHCISLELVAVLIAQFVFLLVRVRIAWLWLRKACTVYVCMYVCMCVCMCGLTGAGTYCMVVVVKGMYCVCMHVCMYVFMYVCMYICMEQHMVLLERAHTVWLWLRKACSVYVCMFVCMYVWSNMWSYWCGPALCDCVCMYACRNNI